MPESAFTVTFGVPVCARGRIPVRDLSPALLALGELFAAASVLVDPDREPATLSIDTIAAGSTSISLVLEIAEQTTRLTDLLTTDATTTLRILQEVVIGPIGVLDLARQVAGREVVQQAPAGPHIVRVTLADGTAVDARTEAVELYLDGPVRPTERRRRRAAAPAPRGRDARALLPHHRADADHRAGRRRVPAASPG